MKFRDPTVTPAWEALCIAIIEGAQAIGLGDEIDSLEVGKHADLIPVDLKALNPSPVLEAPVRNGVVITVDEEAVRAETQTQADALAQRVAADPVHKGMALLEAMEAGQL